MFVLLVCHGLLHFCFESSCTAHITKNKTIYLSISSWRNPKTTVKASCYTRFWRAVRTEDSTSFFLREISQTLDCFLRLLLLRSPRYMTEARLPPPALSPGNTTRHQKLAPELWQRHKIPVTLSHRLTPSLIDRDKSTSWAGAKGKLSSCELFCQSYSLPSFSSAFSYHSLTL